jgi:hypothetical protein
MQGEATQGWHDPTGGLILVSHPDLIAQTQPSCLGLVAMCLAIRQCMCHLGSQVWALTVTSCFPLKVRTMIDLAGFLRKE